MTNENTQVAIFSEEVATQKSKGWANMGKSIYTTEISLQNKALEIQSLLVAPTKYEEVAEAEKTLKSVITDTLALETERKKVTSVLDEVAQRLMIPEKNCKEAVNNFKTAIITVKSAQAKIEAEKKKKEDEINQLILWLKNDKSQKIADIKKFISDQCNEMFKAALETDIIPFEIDMFVTTKMAHFPTELLKHTPPKVQINLVSMDELKSLIAEHHWFDINGFITEWENALELKFSDYAVAYENKALALKKSEADKLAADKLAADKLAADKLAAELQAKATPVAIATGVKELKKSFKVDFEAMGNTPDSAKIIISCLFANWKFLAPKIRTKDWFKLSVANIIVAIEGYKNEDNLFEFSGVIFKQIEKL